MGTAPCPWPWCCSSFQVFWSLGYWPAWPQALASSSVALLILTLNTPCEGCANSETTRRVSPLPLVRTFWKTISELVPSWREYPPLKYPPLNLPALYFWITLLTFRPDTSSLLSFRCWMTLCKQALGAPDSERLAASFCGGETRPGKEEVTSRSKCQEEMLAGLQFPHLAVCQGVVVILGTCRCLCARHAAF